MKKLKMILSILLILTMVCTAFMPALAAEDFDTEEPGEFSPAMRVDMDALRASMDRMPNNAISVYDFFAQKNSADGPEMDMPTLTDEEAYVLDVSYNIAHPVGLQFTEKHNDEEMIEAIVWLTELPEVLNEYYKKIDVQDKVYDMAKADAVTTRQSLRNLNDPRLQEITGEHSYVFSGFCLIATPSLLKEIATWPGVFCVQEEPVYELTDYDTYIPDPFYETPGNGGARELFDLDYLHSQGIDGRGVKVGVIDSSILITHPDIVGAYKGGYNYATTSTNMGPTSPGGTQTDSGDHGMHTSGTIASQGKESLGIAPGVDLYFASVGTSTGGLGATTNAVNDMAAGNASRGIPKCDVVNCSWGTPSNTAYDAAGYSMSNAALSGTMFVVSAGNNGDKGNNKYRIPYTLGSPSSAATLALSVAASEWGGTPTWGYDLTLGSDSILVRSENLDQVISPLITLDFFDGMDFFVALNARPLSGTEPTTLAYLQGIPAGSLAGKVLVVGRGINFTDYKAQGLRTGAAAVLIINRDEEFVGNMNISADTTVAELPLFSTPVSSWVNFFSAYAQGSEISGISSARTKIPYPNSPTSFSSLGPVKETGDMKPDIIAPGYQIYSTSFLGSGASAQPIYRLMSGTSMSAPCITGVYALVKQAYPDASCAELKARLMNTANPFELIPHILPAPNGNPGTAISVWEQGAGFVNPIAAVEADNTIRVSNTMVTTAQTPVFVNNMMASFSFHEQAAGATTPALLAEINGLWGSYDVELVPEMHTRYSEAWAGNVTPLLVDNYDGTFTLQLEIDEDAERALYEGYVHVDVDGTDYYLPWGVRVGAPLIKGPDPILPMGDEDFIVFPDKPVMLTNDAATSIAENSVANKTFSKGNTLYFQIRDEETSKYLEVRTVAQGLLGIYGNTFAFPIYLQNIDNPGTTIYRVEAHFGWTGQGQNPITGAIVDMGTSGVSGLTRLDQAFSATGEVASDVFQVSMIGTQANGVSTNSGGSFNTTATNIPAGRYRLGVRFVNSSTANGNQPYPGTGGNGFHWMDNSFGILVSNKRVTLTYHDATLDPVGDTFGDVIVNTNGQAVYTKPYALGATEATITGCIYSEALDDAVDAGLMWTGVYALLYGMCVPLEYLGQSQNILESRANGTSALSGTPIDFENVPTSPWICDEFGEFEITMPVSALGAPDSNGNRTFLNTTGNLMYPADLYETQYNKEKISKLGGLPGYVDAGHTYGLGSIPFVRQEVCTHPNPALDPSTEVIATDCQTEGFEASVVCPDCGEVIEPGASTGFGPHDMSITGVESIRHMLLLCDCSRGDLLGDPVTAIRSLGVKVK
ncbi:MAG: S8 family serine peptidase, partial [Clostridiales bacterium]|nr:S8 family serine peptidase [Clostridiales bacterium]